MFRRFQQHDLRLVTELNGVWDFAFLGDVDPEAVDVASIEFNDRMAVPGCFDATPGYAGQRGLVAYRTRAILHDDTPHRLILDGVHYWCRVFVGGQALRDHAGGFTRFATDIVGHPAGETEVVVLVDNRFDYERCPLHLDYFDWYHYGGIARGAESHRLGDLWIDALKVVTQDIATREVALTIDYGAVEPPGPTDLTVTCDGQVVLSEKVDLAATRAASTTKGWWTSTAGLSWPTTWSSGTFARFEPETTRMRRQSLGLVRPRTTTSVLCDARSVTRYLAKEMLDDTPRTFHCCTRTTPVDGKGPTF